jgi:hypothetical protein
MHSEGIKIGEGAVIEITEQAGEAVLAVQAIGVSSVCRRWRHGESYLFLVEFRLGPIPLHLLGGIGDDDERDRGFAVTLLRLVDLRD